RPGRGNSRIRSYRAARSDQYELLVIGVLEHRPADDEGLHHRCWRSFSHGPAPLGVMTRPAGLAARIACLPFYPARAAAAPWSPLRGDLPHGPLPSRHPASARATSALALAPVFPTELSRQLPGALGGGLALLPGHGTGLASGRGGAVDANE